MLSFRPSTAVETLGYAVSAVAITRRKQVAGFTEVHNETTLQIYTVNHKNVTFYF